MTTNQLQYNQLLETTRHNQVAEEISKSQQLAQAEYWRATANSARWRNILSGLELTGRGIDYGLVAVGL